MKVSDPIGDLIADLQRETALHHVPEPDRPVYVRSVSTTDVTKIRILYAAGVKQKHIAARFHVSISKVGRVIGAGRRAAL